MGYAFPVTLQATTPKSFKHPLRNCELRAVRQVAIVHVDEMAANLLDGSGTMDVAPTHILVTLRTTNPPFARHLCVSTGFYYLYIV